MKRLYLVVRSDLSPGQQAVQACHVLREFVEAHPEVDQEWFAESNTLVLLAVDDEPALARLLNRARRRRVPVVSFQEPDLGNSTTAVALAPSGCRLCRRLPLALQAS